jgi:hypothetical protein
MEYEGVRVDAELRHDERNCAMSPAMNASEAD